MPEQINNSLPELQFSVAQILKETTGATRQHTIETTTIRQLDDNVHLAEPLTGSVTFLRTGRDILVTGHLETIVEKSCARCLAPFEAAIIVELEEVFYPTVDLMTGERIEVAVDADYANRISEIHILDLSEVVRQSLLLESEGVRYCNLECKGLCPKCGQDLNQVTCSCADEAIDLRWSGLLSVKVED
jgi:uncharacterized protein